MVITYSFYQIKTVSPFLDQRLCSYRSFLLTSSRKLHLAQDRSETSIFLLKFFVWLFSEDLWSLLWFFVLSLKYLCGIGRQPGACSCCTHCLLMAAVNNIKSFQNSLLAAVAAAALCLIVYYCHENHLFHPHLGAPPKWDRCTTKMGQDRPSRHYK